MKTDPEVLTPAELSEAKQRTPGPGWLGRPSECPRQVHRVEGADRRSPLARTRERGKLSDELSAPPAQGSPAAGPPLSDELPPSSSGGWRPPEEAPTQGSVTRRERCRVAAGDSLPRVLAPIPPGAAGEGDSLPRGRGVGDGVPRLTPQDAQGLPRRPGPPPLTSLCLASSEEESRSSSSLCSLSSAATAWGRTEGL